MHTKEDLSNLSAIEVYKLILMGRINKFPRGFWKQNNIHNSIECIKYLIENELQWSEDDIKNKISMKIFKKYKLSGMLRIVFDDSPYKAIDSAYPKKFREWELCNVPRGF